MDVGTARVLMDELPVAVDVLVPASEPVGVDVIVVAVAVDVLAVVLTGLVAMGAQVVATEHEAHPDGSD